MAAPLLLSVKDATVRFQKTPLFENLSFNIHERSRIALVGKNGAGKSTLMNIITGVRELDEGTRWQEQAISFGYLHQDITPKEGQSVFEYIFEEIQGEERELHQYKVDIVAQALHLNTNDQMTRLSGGQVRRAGLARVLVEEPDILLLDEPTNHLDLEAIEWLEGYLRNYRGTILCISHDRTFLANVTTQVFWLDRGTLKVAPRGFAHFEEWSAMLLEQEERELKNRKSIVAQEVAWANKGVKARRKRNVRRVELVKEMRDKLKADQSSYKRASTKIKLEPPKNDEATSKIVTEFYGVHKKFDDGHGDVKNILDGFNLRIRHGDRIGVLGKNGSGKTTFLKMLIGEMEPDQGRVKRKKELKFSYFDQKRRDLKPEVSLRKTLVPSGGDYIKVMGKERHVCGYLKDFLFDPADAHIQVSTLSGGQKNRLMLAKILANPGTCLILDEPTNDLDMDTLDMLEETLMNYEGTLIVVSHDRDFLDQTVTQILAFEGDAQVERVIGGYSDYLAIKKGQEPPKIKKATKPEKETKEPKSKTLSKAPKPKTPAVKLSYKLQRELDKIPAQIEKLEVEKAELSEKMADTDFYTKDQEGFFEATKRLERVGQKLALHEERWLELEAMREEGAA